jgi:regulator of protease activity HflC (stomatin/prohibitin superfamily)
MAIGSAILLGFIVWFVLRCLISGFYTVDQNERAVVTTFGKAPRFGNRTTLDDPVSATLHPDERERYVYPLLHVTQPGLHFKFPWQRVFKVSVATQTMNIAHDPDVLSANDNGTALEAVTKDQLNTSLKGQIRYAVNERNLYAYIFGVKRPISHVMGYFVSILRERIANFEAPAAHLTIAVPGADPLNGSAASHIPGISINDLRKNLSELNRGMEQECKSSVARYGIELDAALIIEIDPPREVESALAAINTAHNQVSSEISLAQASADQKIVQSKRAVEIETLKAQAEVQLLKQLAHQLGVLKQSGPAAMKLYLRNIKLKLFNQAKRVIVEAEQS